MRRTCCSSVARIAERAPSRPRPAAPRRECCSTGRTTAATPRSISLTPIRRAPGCAVAGSRSMRNRKLGDARMRRSPRWMPASNAAFGATGAVEREQRLDIARRSPGRDRRVARAWTECVARTASSDARSGRPADEHRCAWPACPSVGRAASRAGDRDVVHRRVAEVQLVGRAREPALRRLQHAFGFPVPAHERDADVDACPP